MKIIFSTANTEDLLSHRIIVGASRLHEELHRGGEPLQLYQQETKIRIGSFIHFVGVLIRALAYGALFGSSAVRINYRSISIGKYAVSMALRHPAAYLNKPIYYERLLRYLLVCIRNVDNFMHVKKDVVACYINDPAYTNGVYSELAAKFRIPLYHNMYPYRLSRFAFSEGVHAVEAFVVQPPQTVIPDREKIGRQIIERIVASTEKIEYMATIKFEFRELAPFDADAIVYAHSFTDAQHSYGGDSAFLSMYDWLLFTLEALKDKRVILKAHPAFFRQGYAAQVIEWDRKVFEALVNHIKGRPNLIIVDWPMRNIELLEKARKDCILISHHGNALLEGASLGFRCISSIASSWKKYRLFNTWTTREEYHKLLQNPIGLEKTVLDTLYGYMFDLYEGKQSFFHPDGWRHVVARETGISASEISRSQAVLKSLPTEEIDRLINIVSEKICDVDLR